MPAEARTSGYCISSPTRFSFLRSVVLCVRGGGGVCIWCLCINHAVFTMHFSFNLHFLKMKIKANYYCWLEILLIITL